MNREQLGEDWRESLLRAAFLIVGTGLVVGITVYRVFVPTVPAALVTSFFLGGLANLAASRFELGSFAARGAMLIATSLALLAILVAHTAWTPAFSLYAVFIVLLAGLLFGRSAGLVVVIGIAILMQAGVHAVEAGFLNFPAAEQSANSRNWIRVALMFGVIVSPMVMMINRALQALAVERQHASANLAAASAELVRADTARGARLEVEVSLRDAHRLRTVSHLAGGLTFQLRSTLAAVRGAVAQLGAAPDSRRIHQVCSELLEAARHSAGTIRNLLVFSRQVGESHDPIRFAEVLDDMAETLRAQLPSGIRLEIESGETPTVLADRTRLEQVVLNLVFNARDALPSGGNIRIATGTWVAEEGGPVGLPPGRYASISVSDDGVGISPEVLAQICEPFFSLKRRDRHDGLGLFIAFGLAQRWGGLLDFQSQIGTGTKVTLYLPIAEEMAEESTQTGDRDSRQHRVANARVESSPSPTFDPAANRLRAVTPQPPPDTKEVPEWKRRSLQRILISCAAGLLCVVAMLVIFNSNPLPTLTILLLLGAIIMGVTWWTESLDFHLRAALMTGVVAALAVWSIYTRGFMNPSAVAGLASLVLTTSLFFGRAAAWGAFAAATGVFLVGALIPMDPIRFEPGLPENPQNWRRVGVMFPIVCLILTQLVLEVFEAAKKSVAVLVDSRASLELAHEENEEQAAALLAIERGATRAEVMRTAGQVAGSVAHDLNNALTPIIGWAELLVSQPNPAPEDVAAACQDFSESADYAEALVDQLDSSEKAGGDVIEAVDIKALVEESASVIRRLVGSDVEVETHLEPGCIVSISRTELRRALLNFATNARDAMPTGGRLSFELTRDELGVTLSIADDGMGMDDETRSHVFDAFYTTKEPGYGTGLGLLAVARVVGASGGEVAVESEPGEGTRFTIRWPDVERSSV